MPQLSKQDVIAAMAVGFYGKMAADKLRLSGLVPDATAMMLERVAYEKTAGVREQCEALIVAGLEELASVAESAEPDTVVLEALRSVMHRATKLAPSVLLMGRDVVDLVRVHAVDVTGLPGAFIASCPTLGISGTGNDHEGAMQALYGAAAVHLKDHPELRAAGRPIEVQAGDAVGLACSFCGKERKDVTTLIVGPRVTICNECVQLSTEIIAEQRAAEIPARG